ncbi:DUF5776 domain-containing protein [Levilactobacillus yonginensis]|uniref:DUF5776 domain-containing protein n=1 Tax=Levilactobacillus yonginensis TaxID=1054041 RepID=UPI000F796234|nr:DUF5776 domain-containing protein [Levilactobacillus yonginensis]
MNRILKQVTVSGLTLLLLGGIVTPSVASADTTSSAPTTTSTKDATSADLKVSGFEMPYVSLRASNGKETRVYRYPKLPATLSVQKLQQADYREWVIAQYPNDKDLAGIANSGGQIEDAAAERFAGKQNSSQSIIDYMSEISGTKVHAELVAANSAMMAWIIGAGTKFEDGKLTQSDVQKSFKAEVTPLVEASLKIDSNDRLKAQFENYQDLVNVKSADDFATKMTQATDIAVESLFGPQVSRDRLAKINADGTYKAMLAAYNAPMSTAFLKQADGTYVLGQSVTQIGGAGIAIFVEGVDQETTTPTDPTPAKSQPVTVHFVDVDGHQIAADKTLTGKLGDSYHAEAQDVSGYKLSKMPANATGKFTGSAQSVTYTYDAVVQSGSAGATIAPKGTVIYATKKIGLYKQATFTKQARQQWYQRKSRMNRPMFVVTGYAKSKNGVKRYKVRDVNHHSKTVGKTGYVTANAKYTVPVYYATKHNQITVINPKGINAYSKKTLTGKQTHYRQGQVLKVKKIVSHNLTTRFVLSNGRYITANKQLVQAGKRTMPKRVTVKRGINRYQTANLTKRNHHYSAGTVLKVKGWTDSNANNFSKGDSLRYQVSGGYITANQRFVRSTK